MWWAPTRAHVEKERGSWGGRRPPHLQTREECITWDECHICRRVFVSTIFTVFHLAWNLPKKQPEGEGGGRWGDDVGRTSVQGCRC